MAAQLILLLLYSITFLRLYSDAVPQFRQRSLNFDTFVSPFNSNNFGYLPPFPGAFEEYSEEDSSEEEDEIYTVRITEADIYKPAGYPEVYSGQFEGDMVLPEAGLINKNALYLQRQLWPSGVIPFVITANSFNPTAQFMIRESMKRIQAKTCIKFVPYNGRGPYVRITSYGDNRCFSSVGYQPGQNYINYGGAGCMNFATIQHELFHTIGLYHEQSRRDRDQYVTIWKKNIIPKFLSQFEIPDAATTTFNLPYDYQSVMHYPSDAFSANRLPTITAKGNTGIKLSNRIGPTNIDFQKVKYMYRC